MKFKVKAKPTFGDRKTVVKFAWFPKRVEDTIVWLEEYLVVYRYTKDSFGDYDFWDVVDKKVINKQD